jgi:hypothetical protein
MDARDALCPAGLWLAARPTPEFFTCLKALAAWARWVRMFDNEFYRQVFRLNNWPFDPEKTTRPSVIGH